MLNTNHRVVVWLIQNLEDEWDWPNRDVKWNAVRPSHSNACI